MRDESKKFGAQGGAKRAANMTPAQRKESARKAAVARWGAGIPTAKYGSPERPLRLGDIEMQCYVLDDGRRVIVQRGLQTGIGMSTSGGSGGAQRMARFIASLEAKGLDTNDLSVRMATPILFQSSNFGKPAYGYEATILTEICRVVLEARKRGFLLDTQAKYADQCEILLGGLADVGISALVDEATGYQSERARDALAKILEAFVQKELRKWVSTFPADFYKELCRLRNVEYPPEKMRLPPYFGNLTNNIVYDRLAYGVKDELKRVEAERRAEGRGRGRLHQHLTKNVGVPKLSEHLAAVTVLMKIAPNYAAFERNLDTALPKLDANLMLPLDDS